MSAHNTTHINMLELLASKICHDLVSPIGAVSNGVEFLEDMGGSADTDITDLISHSAGQANAKLKTFRMAYGLGGADDNIRPDDVHSMFNDYISSEKRLSLQWDDAAHFGTIQRKGFAKTLLCTLMLLIESLPKGGVIAVTADDATCTVTATSETMGFRDGITEALEATLPDTPTDAKLIHPYLTGRFAEKYGFTLTQTRGEMDDGQYYIAFQIS